MFKPDGNILPEGQCFKESCGEDYINFLEDGLFKCTFNQSLTDITQFPRFIETLQLVPEELLANPTSSVRIFSLEIRVHAPSNVLYFVSTKPEQVFDSRRDPQYIYTGISQDGPGFNEEGIISWTPIAFDMVFNQGLFSNGVIFPVIGGNSGREQFDNKFLPGLLSSNQELLRVNDRTTNIVTLNPERNFTFDSFDPTLEFSYTPCEGVLFYEQCIPECPSGFINNNGTCDRKNCLCTYDENDICSSCTETAFIHQGDCVLVCPTGFTPNTLSRTCEQDQN